MQFDPDNNIVKLCAQGMAKEGEGKPEEAYELFTHESRKSNFDFRYDHNLPLNQE